MRLLCDEIVSGEEVMSRHVLMTSDMPTPQNESTGGPDLSQPWDYDESVARVRGKYLGSYRKIEKSLLEELYQAKLQLNKGRGNPHGRFTWKDYCVTAFQGYPCKEAIDNWLHRYEIGEDAYREEQQAKKEKKDFSRDHNSMFVTKSKNHGDGNYTVWLSLPEYTGQTIVRSFHV